MESSKKNTNTRLILIIVAVVAVLLVVGGVAFALFGKGASDNKTGDSGQVSTKQRLMQDAEEVNASIKTNEANQQNAKAAIEDQSKQIKVGR